MKNIIIFLLLIVVALGGYYMYTGKSLSSFGMNDQATTTSETPVMPTDGETMTPGQGNAGKHSVKWVFSPAGTDESISAEKTKVTLEWDGKTYDAGTYLGSCAELDGTNGTLQPGQVSGVLCWFAGAGDEVGVFNENGKFVLKHGEQQEPSAEEQGFRGNFKTLLSL